MKTNSVFSISEGIIKFLQVSASARKQVTAVDVIDITNQPDAGISETLSAFVKKQKLNFAESRVTLLVPRSRVILRFMVFPSQKQEEIRSMIDLQVGNHIPYAREEVEIDFQVLSMTADGYAKVAVVIIPQDIAMRYWNIFSNAKIPVHGMSITSIGLWLLYQQQPGLPDKPGAIFDLDLNHSEICLCYKTHWLTSREIPIGFEQMQKDGYAGILEQWELTQQNTNGEKFTEKASSVFLTCTANRAYLLGTEMVKVQDDLAIKDIQLTKSLGLARGVQWPKLMLEDGVSVAALAGVAYSAQTPPIDLIPREVKLAKEGRFHQRRIVVAGIWAFIAMVSLAVAVGVGFFKKNAQLAGLEDQLRQTKQDALSVENRLAKINDIQGMIKGRLIFSGLAGEIYRLLPKQIYLMSISVSDGNVLSFQGVSSNAVDVNQFQKNMVDSPDFSNVSLDYVNKRVTQQGEVDYFKITCTLKSVDVQK